MPLMGSQPRRQDDSGSYGSDRGWTLYRPETAQPTNLNNMNPKITLPLSMRTRATMTPR